MGRQERLCGLWEHAVSGRVDHGHEVGLRGDGRGDPSAVDPVAVLLYFLRDFDDLTEQAVSLRAGGIAGEHQLVKLQEGLLEGLLHLPHAVAASAGILRVVHWIHNVEQCIFWVGELLLLKVGAAVCHGDGRLHVVEVASKELEKLDEEDSKIAVTIAGSLAWVQLKEAHHEEDKCVGTDSTKEDFVQISLCQELLEN